MFRNKAHNNRHNRYASVHFWMIFHISYEWGIFAWIRALTRSNIQNSIHNSGHSYTYFSECGQPFYSVPSTYSKYPNKLACRLVFLKKKSLYFQFVTNEKSFHITCNFHLIKEKNFPPHLLILICSLIREFRVAWPGYLFHEYEIRPNVCFIKIRTTHKM